ncbi:MAG: iron chelate uptake ABC transporter family permease subunit [Chitinivibrionales bacterium]|nr:iron chelate uptake ABC transporter family permease subunit [Chitinivibrionales bacterium]
MTAFFYDLSRYSFLQLALAAGLLASVSSGIVGSLIVVRRSTYIAGAISHCILGGMGVARYLQTVHDITWLTPLAGAVIASMIAALIIGWTTVFGKERSDSVFSIVWALGMAIGITFIMKTPGYGQDLMSYLFGSILMVSVKDVWLMAVLDILVVALVLLFYNRILAVCFNEETARARGIPVGVYTMIILVTTALTTVLLVQVVGIVLVIALLTLPAATVSQFVQKLSLIMIWSAVLCFLLVFSGLVISYGPELPVGATIIELAGLVYLCALGINRLKYSFKK